MNPRYWNLHMIVRYDEYESASANDPFTDASDNNSLVSSSCNRMAHSDHGEASCTPTIFRVYVSVVVTLAWLAFKFVIGLPVNGFDEPPVMSHT